MVLGGRLGLKLVLRFREVKMTEKSKGLWKTDMKTATAAKAIGGALLAGGVAGDLWGQDVAMTFANILALLFGM